MGKAKITVEGVDKLARQFVDVAEQARAVAETAVSESADAVRAEAAGLAPQDTGGLTASIRVERSADGMTAEVGPTDDGYYGAFQEFGTSRFPAQPFMGPAAESELPKYRDRMVSAINGVLPT